MRLVFMGSGEFATITLTALLESDHEVVMVFTQPDRHAGRGQHTRSTPVKARAAALGIPVEQPETLKDGSATEILRSANPELAVVVAYGHLIPADMLTLPARGFINAHASLLPKFWGAAPVPHAILAGEKETGVSIFRLNERFDAGDVLARDALAIGPEDTSAALLERLAPMAARLMLEVVGQMAAGWQQPVQQIEAEATKAPKLRKAMGEIDWNVAAIQIDRCVRAFQPWPLSFTHFPLRRGRQRVSVLKVSPAPSLPDADAEPGTVLAADGKQGILVQCADGPLQLVLIKAEGKREMPSAEYMRGARLEIGCRLG